MPQAVREQHEAVNDEVCALRALVATKLPQRATKIPRLGHRRSATEECCPTKVDHLPSTLGLALAELGWLRPTKHPAPSNVDLLLQDTH